MEYTEKWINFFTPDRSFIVDFDNILGHETQERKERTEEELKEIFELANSKAITPDNRSYHLKGYLYKFI